MANIFRGSFMNTDHSLEDFQDKKVGSFSIPQNENYHLSENSTSTFFPIENLFPDTIKNMNSSAENEVRNTNRIIGNNDSQFEKEVSEEEIEENADSFSSSSEMDDSELAETQSKIKSASSLENKKEFKPHKRKLKVEDAGEDVEPHSKKKRGRPSGKHPDLKPKIIQKMVGSVANNALSVRSIPCFYRDCSYSYKRPGSTIVEISDRPLVLPKKFGNFTIRSCKKHHDKWKSKSRSLCEVCKGLNCTIPNSLSEIKAYVNANQVTFTLCDFCADRQREMLQLLPGSSEVKPDMLTFEDVDEEESRPEGSEDMEMDGQGADVGQHTRPKKFTVYKRTSQPNGWNLVKGVNYISSCIWDVGQVPVQRPNIVYVDKDPPQLSIRKVNDVLGIFADNNIQPGTCLGEFTGRVVERKGKHRRYCLGLTPEWDIDASTHSNEFRFIADSLGVDACCNVKFEIVDNSVLVITTQKLKKNDQLFADFGSSSSEKERQYVEYFNSIQQFNQENLTAEELSNAAFQWFIEEGCKLLHAKAKITVPIEKRHPAKKSIANNYSIKKQNVVKNENEWGYVAQLERLDLERAREDCWVTFKAGKGWNFESFSRAVLVWKKSGNYVEVPNPPKKIMPPTTVSPIVKKEKDHSTKLITKPKKEKYENRVQLLSFLSQEFTASRQLEDIVYQDLVISFDGALLGGGGQGYAYVFKGYWRGYPVAVRFPPFPTSDEDKKRFLDSCSIASLIHPNIVTAFGSCKKDQVCLVMELMNLGNLKQWLTKSQPHVHAMYIPRIALDVARAMEFIHSKNTMHSNLKSANILMKGEILDQGLVANLEVKIGDLGAIPDENFTTYKRQETENFMAPEYLKTKIPSREADVYSFGKILCHLFSEGQEQPKQPHEVMATSHYLDVWDPKWKELINRCCSVDPSNRPKFTEILEILMKLMDSARV